LAQLVDPPFTLTHLGKNRTAARHEEERSSGTALHLPRINRRFGPAPENGIRRRASDGGRPAHFSDVVDANPGDGECETAHGNGVCTLRAAIMEANRATGSTIPFGLPLAPGNYTTILSGKNSIAGNALVEAYRLN
jgi:hypothetical protein